MNVLLDTCAIIWAVADPERLSVAQRDVLQKKDTMREAYSLPGHFHQDPADRIMVATARKHDLTILTGDRKIIDYPHVKSLGC